MEDFIPDSLEVNNGSFPEKTERTESFLQETQNKTLYRVKSYFGNSTKNYYSNINNTVKKKISPILTPF